MIDFIFASANTPFAVAIALMLIVGLFEGVGAVLGVGIGSVLDSLIPDIDVNADIEVAEVGSNNALSRLLGWLKVGKVPILMLLVILLIAFGGVGYLLNYMAYVAFGILIPILVSVPIAFIVALPITRAGASTLELIMPKDETSSISLESLIGREAWITLGQSTSTTAAEARVRDQHGNTHYVMVKAEDSCGPFGPGTPLLMVRRQGNQFVVIEAESSAANQ